MKKIQLPYAFTYSSNLMGCEIRVDTTVMIIDDRGYDVGPQDFRLDDIEIHEITGMVDNFNPPDDGADWTILKDFDPLVQEILSKIDNESTLDYLMTKVD